MEPKKTRQQELDEKALKRRKAVNMNTPGGQYQDNVADRIGRPSIMGELPDHNRDGNTR